MNLGYAFTWLTNPKLASWDINVVADALPQKVATAFAEANEIVGARYEPIAYLGKQLVNGVNHAVLAKQTLFTSEEIVRVVLMLFNEKEMNCTLYAIETVLDCGGALGGWSIDPTQIKDLPEETVDAIATGVYNWIGAEILPVVYLGSKVTNGVNHIFVATVTPVVPNAKASVKLIMTNTKAKTIDFIDIL